MCCKEGEPCTSGGHRGDKEETPSWFELNDMPREKEKRYWVEGSGGCWALEVVVIYELLAEVKGSSPHISVWCCSLRLGKSVQGR